MKKRALARSIARYSAIYLVVFSIFSAPLCLAQTSPAPASRPTPSSPSAPPTTPGQLPNLGDGTDMTSSVERRMGDRIAREIYRDPDYIDDPVLAEYVQGIWQPLLAAARARGDLTPELDERFAWEVMMGKDRSVNAFALPGGYFGLHLGLMAIVTSRDELASVLGHELSHVTQRHISRIISKQSTQAPWLIGAMILGALAASKSPEAANALIVGGQAVAAQNQLNFSRDMEREADRIGFGVMTQAGFEPAGFVTMFEKLQQASRLNDNGSFPYLRSHPLTTERVADMQARVPPGAPQAGNSQASSQSPEHAMVAARATVLSNPGVDALRAWAPLVAGAGFGKLDLPRQAAALYGATLAALRLRDLPGAATLVARLADLFRADATRVNSPGADALRADGRAARLARLLAVEVALAGDDARRAVTLLDAKNGAVNATLPPAPGRPELVFSSQALVRTGQASAAAQQLQTWVANHPRDALAWQLLSSAYAAQGQSLRSIRADAEAQVAQLDYAGAADRFKAAQELARELGRKGTADHIEASIIDTRARQTALLLKEQAVER
jgi:predicted Zn-dependent protease